MPTRLVSNPARLRRGLLLLAVAALAGCASPRQFARPDASWHARTGQLRFGNAGRTVIGDVLVRWRGTQEFQLDFLAGPGVPLMQLRMEGTRQTATGLLARGPASRRRAWFALRERFVREPVPPVFTVAAPGGERFEFRFR